MNPETALILLRLAELAMNTSLEFFKLAGKSDEEIDAMYEQAKIEKAKRPASELPDL